MNHNQTGLSGARSLVFTLKFVLFTIALIAVAILLSIYGGGLYRRGAVAAEASQKAYKEGETWETSVYKNKYRIIILDPGHGGEDSGARSKSGLLEKDVNLNISKHLFSMLKLSDAEVCLTRSDDRLLYYDGQEKRKKYNDLCNRVKIANQHDDGIFVSIHQNYFPQSKYHGFQVYYSKNNPDSEVLAKIMQGAAKKHLQPENERPIRPAGQEILILHQLEMPAILAECGFLSNAEEAERLSDENYQKKIAFTLFISIMQFLYS